MTTKPLFNHPQEEARQLALQSLQILETPIEERFERITRLACQTLDMPVCAIPCIDNARIWFKSVQGMDACESPRSISFCQHAILNTDITIVEDARLDERFAQNPLVTDEPHIVFYAGVPIYSFDRLPIATLCVIDTKERSFGEKEIAILKDLARMAQHELHAHSPNHVQDKLIHQIGETWRKSLIDPLTRVWNHDGIEAVLSEMLNNSKLTQGNVFVIKIDPCNFAQINDVLGHEQGDAIIKSMAADLLQEIGDHATLGRLEQDQFALLFDTVHNLQQAKETADRINRFVKQYPLEGIDGRDTIGGSIAAVLISGQVDTSIDSVFEHFDDAMFCAKKLDEYQINILGDFLTDPNKNTNAA